MSRYDTQRFEIAAASVLEFGDYNLGVEIKILTEFLVYYFLNRIMGL